MFVSKESSLEEREIKQFYFPREKNLKNYFLLKERIEPRRKL